MTAENITPYDPKYSQCPTCGQLLPTAHLVQLNITLDKLLSAGASNTSALVVAVVDEIVRVSKRTKREITHVVANAPEKKEAAL